MEMYAIYTRDDKSMISNLIRSETGGDFSHCGLGFVTEEAPTDTVFFECTWALKHNTAGGGLRGPLPLSYLDGWKAEDFANRHYEVDRIMVSDTQAKLAYSWSLHKVGMVSYAPLSLPLTLLALRAGISIGPRLSTELKWTCSEYVCRALPAEIQVYAIGIGRVTWDFVVPDSEKFPSIRSGIRCWNDKKYYKIGLEKEMEKTAPGGV